MKIEPKINTQKLTQTILKEYGFEIEEIKYMPKGAVGLSFVAQCKENKKYFIKIYPATRLAKISIQNLDFSLRVCYDLYTKCSIKHISYPLLTKAGELKTYFEHNPLVIFNFIEGKNQDNIKLSNKELVNVSKLLASVHKNTNKIEQEKALKEKFNVGFKDELINGINILEQIKRLNNKYKIKLAKLLIPKKNEILRLLKKTIILSKSIRIKEPDFVICHTDPIHLNLIINENHDVFLIDWDGVKLAPKEHDLWFYLWDNPTLFLSSYEKIYGNIKLNREVLLFYFYYRILEDLTDWVLAILNENIEDEQNKSDLREVEFYCLERIENIDKYKNEISKNVIDHKNRRVTTQ